MCGKKIHHWYKDCLSGFSSKEEQEKLHEHDIVDPDIKDKSREVKTVTVPIFKSENFGKNMSVDDKNIGGIGYMIFRNKCTGKIALMIATTKLKLIKPILYLLSSTILFNVEKITCDLAPGFHWFFKEVFPRSIQIADKFHVVKHCLDALQDVRIRYRQMFLTKRRKAYEKHKKDENHRAKECERNRIPYKRKKFEYEEIKYENGETPLELLAKSRYLLFQFPHQWEDYQRERATILFREFPEIQHSYELSCKFRNWMKKENIGKSQRELLQEIKTWFQDTEDAEIEEMLNFKNLVERNCNFILNYFEEGLTNADAEALNSRIQRFIGMNIGVKERNFFHYRLKKHFS